MVAKKVDPKKIYVKAPKADASLIENPNTRPAQTENRKGATPLTIMKVEEAAKMISKGKSKNEIIEHLQDKYQLSYDQSRRYWIAGCHFLIPEDQSEFKQALINNNIERLEKIITDSMNDKQYKVAREAIAELNKMMGITGNGGVSVAVRNNPDENTQEFIIKID